MRLPSISAVMSEVQSEIVFLVLFILAKYWRFSGNTIFVAVSKQFLANSPSERGLDDTTISLLMRYQALTAASPTFIL